MMNYGKDTDNGFIIGSMRDIDNNVIYHIMWLDSGARTSGFYIYSEAMAAALRISMVACRGV